MSKVDKNGKNKKGGKGKGLKQKKEVTGEMLMARREHKLKYDRKFAKR